MKFNIKETNTKILNDLKEVVTIDSNISNERFDNLKDDKPYIVFVIRNTEFSGTGLSKKAKNDLAVYVSVSKKNYESGKSDLSDLISEIQDLDDKKEYDLKSIDYDNFVEKINTYTSLIVFELEEKCLQ